ncbi:MAG: hypothetical protein SF051_09340 [Elusimicrobiota bacterium]|nr:hypothetical protein [Elusimicrobiota bacterium]
MRQALALLLAIAPCASAAAPVTRVTLPSSRVAPPAPLRLPPASLLAAPNASLSLRSRLELSVSPAATAAVLVARPAAAPARLVAGPAADAPAGAPEPAVATLERGAALADESPAAVGRLYDATPAAPDFAELSPVREPPAPRAWTPRAPLLKPFAGALNAARRALHQRRLDRAGPTRRLTIEEMGLRETLAGAHGALAAGRPQEAVGSLSRHFNGASAKSWFQANSRFERYREKGLEYYRFAEAALLRAYARSRERAGERALVAEARAAARDGSLLGREYRTTALQDAGAGHCAQHALFNAITASVGFVYPLAVREFIENARDALNTGPVVKGGSRSVAALEASLGLKLGRDVDQGMDEASMARYAALLGLTLASRGPPADEDGWRALVAGPEQPLLTFRMVHPRYRLDEAARRVDGHDYALLHHAVYLLGAVPSPSRGAWLFMVQDSGSGITAFHTAEELTALTMSVQLLDASAPARLPSKKAAQ